MIDNSHLPSLDFSTVMASSIHDMKNSLGAVLSGLDDLQMQAELSAGNNRQVDGLRYQSRRLNYQLMQMLSIYKLQQQLYTPNIQQWPVDELLEDADSEHRALLANGGITLVSEAQDVLQACFDRELIIGVLDNALNNAFRYARKKLHLSAQRWEHAAGYGVVIAICDDGPGYPEAMHISTEHAADVLDFQNGRTGLGLYFCALVADLHRNKQVCGHISCDNQGIEGGGRFLLYLP